MSAKILSAPAKELNNKFICKVNWLIGMAAWRTKIK